MIQVAFSGGTIPGQPLAADIRIASEAGFPLLEMWMPKLEYALQGGSLNFVKNLLKKANLGVHSLVALRDIGFLDTPTTKKMESQAHSFAATAMSLGVPWVVVTPGKRPANIDDDGVKAEFIRVLTTYSRIGRQYGKVGFALEPELGSSVSHLALAWEIIQLAGQASCGLVLDAVHFFTSGGDLRLLTPEVVGRIGVVQLADIAALDSDTARLLPGAGILPLADLMRTMVTAGYRGVVSIEAPAAVEASQDVTTAARAAKASLQFIVGLD